MGGLEDGKPMQFKIRSMGGEACATGKPEATCIPGV
jgi:hypothetical protein